ncbi:competence protein CoiA family protein [Myxococcus sp. NMCA1]|uniref:competence protein CoiA family protein n=1 Tax=Myxococcus sp. NMCA1 TaxID=2996785 RepID=UPI0022855CC1|nr:competence protein CoiA family protein [Myxococcus sp. NMCA1]WAM28270.1 competence protein CoiA family protein [Myxococcus sp. NMCA1]
MLTFAMTDTGAVFGIRDALALRRTGERLPPVHCPVCSTNLIAKLGEKVSHHFAHQPKVAPCFGSTGEGELHISAKLLLLRSLQKMADEGQTLSITRSCRGCGAPTAAAAMQLLLGDRAEVEVWLDPARTLKPDLTLWRGEERLALLEVLATHACGPEKLAALERHGVPMVEVEARAIMGEGGHAPWVAPAPIPFRKELGLRVPTQCDECHAEEEAHRKQHEEYEAARRREEELEEQERLAPRIEARAHCWVHMYLEKGVRRTLLFILVQHWDKGEITHAELHEDKKGRVLQRWEGARAKDFWPLLDEAKAAARQHCRKSATNPWVQLDTYGGFKLGKVEQEPFQRFWWSVKQARWVKVEFQRGLHHRLGVSPEAIERQIQAGRIRPIEVKIFAYAKKVTHALESDGVEQFEKWLRQKNGGELPLRRWRRWRAD